MNCKRLFLILTLALCVSAAAHAQYDRNIVQRLTKVDYNRWHFGFILGLGFNDFRVVPNNYVDEDGNRWYAASGGLKPSFVVGMIVDLRLVDYLNLRFTPCLGLGQRQFQYSAFNPAGEVVDRINTAVSCVTMEVPLYLKYSAKRYGNVRPYIIAGAGALFNMNLDRDKAILLKPVDVEIAFGIGFDIYLEYFKLCPEIKFGFGLLDELNRNHPEAEGTREFICTQSTKRLTARMLTITFNFE
ncbi:MAG: PorT family protein [Paludibacteraceae bacterium]|nr:PorT family protein [Paludibacteraceae bacterium]